MASTFRNRPRPIKAPSARMGPTVVHWDRKVPVPPKIQPTEAESWEAFEAAVMPEDDDASTKQTPI
jgi:hypothetical protein